MGTEQSVSGLDVQDQSDNIDQDRKILEDLTSEQGVILLLESSRSEKEWEANIDRIKMANNGDYPAFWYKSIVGSGIDLLCRNKWTTQHDLSSMTGMVNFMGGSSSPESWNARMNAIRRINNGNLPSDWHELFVTSGLQKEIEQKYS